MLLWYILIRGQNCLLTEMERLSQNYILKKLKEKNLNIFSVFEFQKIFNLNYDLAKKITFRYAKRGIFTKIRKGLYFLNENPPSEFLIANRLYQPSYISFETALSFYSIIPEAIFSIISATPNATRNFLVNNLKFSYQKIKKECFFGYLPQKIDGEIVLIAEPEKALVDFLYFVALGKRKLSYERIDFKKIKIKKLIEYGKCFKKKRLLQIIKNL